MARVRAVAALTQLSRTVLVEHFGMQPEEVRVIPNGRRAEDFPPTDDVRRKTARAGVGLWLDEDVVLYLGRPHRRSGRTSRSRRWRASRPRSAWSCSATAPCVRRASSAPRPFSAPGRFLGTREDVARVLAAADVLVLPSDSEGLPGVLIEAGMAGLPVVASDVGFVREIVLEGVSGFLVRPGDPAATSAAVERALAERTRLGAAGRRYCLDRFEMEKVVDAWEALLHEVCR